MFDNEMHCKKCQIIFNTQAETAWIEQGRPCCPRCGSEEIEEFRRDGKIIEI